MVRIASVVAGVVSLATLAAPAAAQFDGELTASVGSGVNSGFEVDLASLTTDVSDGVANGALTPTGSFSGVPTGIFDFSISSVDNITREVSFSFIFDEGVVPDGATLMDDPLLRVSFFVVTDADPLLADDDAVLEVLSSEFAFSTVDAGLEPAFPFDSAVNRIFGGRLQFGLTRSQSIGGVPVPADEININGFAGTFTYRVVPAPGVATLGIGLAAAGACGRRRKAVTA